MSKRRKNAGWIVTLKRAEGITSEILRAVIACCRTELQRRKRATA